MRAEPDPARKDAPILPARRAAGVCLHLTSLPGRYGIGTLGATARRFVDAVAAMNLDYWQFLPTGPTAAPAHSPYLPLSTFAGDELLIDLDDLVYKGLLRANELQPLADLPRERVDFERLRAAVPALLARAAERFAQRAPAAERRARDEFVVAHDADWLRDYALYRVLKARQPAAAWTDWEAPYAARDDKALERLADDERAALDRTRTIQYLFDRQWRDLKARADARGVRLFGDMPIYVPQDGVDCWSRRDLFRLDDGGRPESVAGVPPDYFSEDGQLWGNPLYDWPRHRAENYAWWTRRLRYAMARAALVRIDHFRGFESYWSVPAGATTARDGRWETGPGGELFAALQSALGALPVVAENLGIITPSVEALRQRFGLPGMGVLQFDLADDRYDAAAMDANCVYYTGTHDNDTAVGWFRGAPGDARRADDIEATRRRVLARTGGPPEHVHEGLVRLAFDTRARLAIAPLQDFLGLGSAARLNTPGTVTGNWRWRLAALPDRQRIERIAALVDATGRGRRGQAP